MKFFKLNGFDIVVFHKKLRLFKLIYFGGCLIEKDAKAREKYLKSWMGKIYKKPPQNLFKLISNGAHVVKNNGSVIKSPVDLL